VQLNPEDVQDIVKLLDSLPYDEFEVQTDTLRVVLRRAGRDGWTQESRVLRSPNIATADVPDVVADQPTDQLAGQPAGQPAADVPVPPGMLAIRAPLPGTFYRAPKPGAAPYVDVGVRVDEDTVIGLVETMKLFNSVYANARGVVVEFLVDDAEFADQEAVLVLVQPDEA
jgi:acetyl-CoA carboxylase biotin carboxyl carrier protein